MRGQAMAEFALILPIILLLMVGAMWFPIAEIAHMQLIHMAQQGANAGAASGDCAIALEAVAATTTRPGATAECVTEPGPPEVLRVTVTETIPVPPILDRFTDGSVSGAAVSVVPTPEPTSTP